MEGIEDGATGAVVAGGGDSRTVRSKLVSEAVETWKKDLVDLGGRNNLLYYRDLQAGTLDLSSDKADALARESLLRGTRTSLSRLFPDPEQLRDAAKRSRTIRSRHRANVEERGLETLKLGFGMATWRTQRSSATPNSPVLLWPTEATPRGAGAEDFDLELGAEPEVNPVLLNLLSTEFGVSIDPSAVFPDREGIPTLEQLESACTRLARACASVPGFEVTQRTILGNFSYAKLPLVRDLELAEEQIAEHVLLSAIAGDPDARDELRDRHVAATDESLVPMPPPDQEFLILDADSSQSRVIGAVMAGADLVVEGPPGTGKSQTIANLIATLIAQGKSVLFVAEKRAAIEAVADRLRQVGLEDVLLDMHDGPTNRRRTAEAVGAALESVRMAAIPDTERVHRTLATRTSQLDAFAAALHSPLEPWGLSPHEVIEGLFGIDAANQTTVRIRGTALESLSREDVEGARGDLSRFIELGGSRLLASSDTGWGPTFCGRRAISAESVERLAAGLDQAEDSLTPLRSLSSELAEVANLTPPTSIAETATLIAAVEAANETLEVFDEGIFDEDLERLEDDIRPAARGAVSRLVVSALKGSFRSARQEVRERLTDSATDQRRLPGLVAQAKNAKQRWRDVGGTKNPARTAEISRLVGTFEQLRGAVAVLTEATGWTDPEAMPLDDLEMRLTGLRRDRDLLIRLPELDRIHQSLIASGFSSIIDESVALDRTSDAAADALEYAWLASVHDQIPLKRRSIGELDNEAHSTTVHEFIEADRAHIASTPDRVRRIWAERATDARNQHPEQAAIVAREARKKRRHIPTRQLFADARDVLTAVKPCWVMSPLVVPQVLPRETCFDVVIFDEASQVLPADAVSSLLRGSRAVVAGDPHQLPPTSFFASSLTDEDDAVDEPEEDEIVAKARDTAVVGGFQSILDVMSALLPPPHGRRSLEWHYRSRDERLITFSNAQKELYDWGMTTFPGARIGDCLSLEEVEFVPRAGQPLSSPDAEVDAVVRLVLDHARNRPEASLGVIAFGIAHANRIEEALRLALESETSFGTFFDEAKDEPFFVKNLERVQGDERESIVLTVGYGRGADGRIRYAFGPINNEGGERRLNVAVTRARSTMTVVASINGRLLDPERTSSIGARMLRDYLLYAESGGRDLGAQTRKKPALNPFERDVERALSEAGLNLIPQFGASGFWIDFAVMHPERPGEPILAIEADGASYHSAPSARDRDRLRQEHLEHLGWQFHRIWSTDWFKNREAEVESALRAVSSAVSGRAVSPQTAAARKRDQEATLPDKLPDELEEQPPGRSERPSVPQGRPISSISKAQLRRVVRWAKSDGLLRTDAELLDEVSRELGYSRKGNRIVEAIQAAIDAEANAKPMSRAEMPPRRQRRTRRQSPEKKATVPTRAETQIPLAERGSFVVQARDVRVEVEPSVSVTGQEIETIRSVAMERRPLLRPGEMDVSELRMGNLLVRIRWSRGDDGSWSGGANVTSLGQ